MVRTCRFPRAAVPRWKQVGSRRLRVCIDTSYSSATTVTGYHVAAAEVGAQLYVSGRFSTFIQQDVKKIMCDVFYLCELLKEHKLILLRSLSLESPSFYILSLKQKR